MPKFIALQNVGNNGVVQVSDTAVSLFARSSSVQISDVVVSYLTVRHTFPVEQGFARRWSG